MTRPTPAARALVGALALVDGATTNEAFKLAGYTLLPAFPFADPGSPMSGARRVIRNGRVIKRTANASRASAWLLKLGRKISALSAAKGRAA